MQGIGCPVDHKTMTGQPDAIQFMTKTKSKTNSEAGLKFRPFDVPMKEVNHNVTHVLTKTKNDYQVKAFLAIAEGIYNKGFRTMTFSDFVSAARPFDLDATTELRDMFSKYIQVLERFGKIEAIGNGCYDEPCYTILTANV